ncbi:MAG: ABC transporter ATP-binding protein/permease [Coriobacteriales bacterium]
MIELKHLRKSYKVGDFEQKALDDVSISFRDNEFVAVLGPSGSGKTTLLNVLGGLDHADTGELVINGTSTKDYTSADWDTYRNHHIGFVFQSYNLIPHQTVLSNVELALTLSGVSREERRARAMAELERVGLGEHANKKPSQLSGGQMQRVAIARALVNDPDIVLADEPTGALDTETGIQVMDLLSEIASDRLVIMVTHNPELAYDYANRIVKLHDGRIADDSNPFDPTKADEQTAKLAASERNRATSGHKKHASMSFLTALALSFNNLMTKKGRTFLTAFAGSIGIIGIAAILALSNGVNNYIAKVEEDTLSSTPLTITQSSFDVTSIMMQAGDYVHGDAQESLPEGVIPESTIMADVLTDVKTNDLKSLRVFFEDNGGNVNAYVNAIVYGYGITPQIYKSDTADGIKQLNPGALSGIMSNDISSSGMFSMMSSASSFQEMLDDQKLLEEQYDVVAGAWPSSYDECVLVLNKNGGISDYTLYALGILDPDELSDLLMDALASEELDVPDTSVEFTQEEALSLTFKVVNECNMYTRASSGSTWVDRSDDEGYMKAQIADGLDLKVVGIIKPSPTASSTSMDEGIGYRHDLILHLIDQAATSPVVEAQQAQPDVDIFTGKTFESLKDDAASSFDMSSLFSIDQSMMARAFNVDNAAIEAAMVSAMSGAGANIDTGSMFADIPAPDFSDLDIDLSAGVPSAGQVAALEQSLGQMSSGVVMGFMQYVSGNPGSMADLPGAWAAYQQSDIYKGIISQAANGIAAGMSGSGEQLQKAFTDAIQKKMNEYMTTQLVPYLQTKMGGMLESYTTSLASSMASALSTAMGTAVSVDPAMFARSITVNMDQDELTSMFMNLARSNDLSYEGNLQTLGYADIADPVTISIYAKSFDDKQVVEDIIDQYNVDMEASGEEDKTISYSDIMGVLMSSVTNIIDMISMVLIAFVSISLVVSSIMIGIITYISVLERKKEIGILRAMGASKGNIANIFNAETVIEGLMSGIFAVLLVALVSIPVNAIVLAMMNISGILALPIGAAIILVLISVFLTFIAGLMPAMNAARRDPVEALRSE